MEQVHRVLDARPVDSIHDHIAAGGGDALDLARSVGPERVIREVELSGLRGRGGAGFPTGDKWASVVSAGSPTAVLVNAAEGEPGTFKDRAILRSNPWRVLEGAAIAAFATGARRIVVGLKESFHEETSRLVTAIEEARSEGWIDGLDVELVRGPDLYLFGEETALLEVAENRPPFPRVVPPHRVGLGDGVADGEVATGAPDPNLAANNVETLANVPGIVAHGAGWFRSVGTEASPGTIVCTVSGDVSHHGVAELPMGTPVAEIIQGIGGGPGEGRQLRAALNGVSNPILPAELFDTPATHEDLRAVGSGLGTAGFMVFDDRRDPVAIARGVARFLSVESCGQCEPCKRDGAAITDDLARLASGTGGPDTVRDLEDRLRTVTDGARCYLARQQYEVTESLLRHFPEDVAAHANRDAPPAQPVTITTIDDLRDGVAVPSSTQPRRQPDWSFDEVDSGEWPAARFGGVEMSPQSVEGTPVGGPRPIIR